MVCKNIFGPVICIDLLLQNVMVYTGPMDFSKACVTFHFQLQGVPSLAPKLRGWQPSFQSHLAKKSSILKTKTK